MRDVIEWQLDDTLDINGWDMQKAMQLAYKGNPVFFEWLNSTKFYYTDETVFPKLKETCEKYFLPKKALYHYWHMGNRNLKEYLQTDLVKLKKYFYALRPIWAAQWIEEYHTIPPVSFNELKEKFCPRELETIIQDLLERKINSDESDMISQIKILNQYMVREFDQLKIRIDSQNGSHKDWNELNAFFQNLVLNS